MVDKNGGSDVEDLCRSVEAKAGLVAECLYWYSFWNRFELGVAIVAAIPVERFRFSLEACKLTRFFGVDDAPASVGS